jgi:hypothetical protein
MTEKEFIEQAKNDWPDEEITDALDACEANYFNGIYDDVSGNVEAPTGFFYIIEHYIVIVNSDGTKELRKYGSVELAERAFNKLEQEYSEWDAEE